MTANGVGCTLYLDGVRVADGAPSDDPEEVTALAGLQITWGRDTTVDQPEPATCSFNLADPPGGNSFLDLLHVGAAVQVRATGTIPAPPTIPANLDPSFENYGSGDQLDWVLAGVSLAAIADNSISLIPAHTGLNYALAIVTGQPGRVVIPPAPFSADPSAWDGLPPAAAGRTFTVSAAVLAPPYCRATVQAVTFTGPTSRTWTAAGLATALTGAPAPTWTPAAPAAFTAPAGRFIGVTAAMERARWTDYPADATWSTADPIWTWVNLSWLRLDDVEILAADPAGHTERDAVVFDGRITDLRAGWDQSYPGVITVVTAADFTADLGQHDVAALPWPAQSVTARFNAILAGAQPAVSIPHTIDPALGTPQVGYLDVDNGQVLPLLQDLATSVDGVLWSATHRTTGPYLWLADPRLTSALYILGLDDAGLLIVLPTGAGTDAIELDACDVLLDPVQYEQTTSDVITRVAATWQEQTLDDDGQPAPTARTELLIDPAAEQLLGRRRMEVTTQLTTSAAARIVAQQLLARLSLTSWRVAGLVWRTDAGDLDTDRITRVLDLLDGTRRLGVAVRLVNLPTWTPAGNDSMPLLLQGGIYTFEDGQWTLELTTSSAAAQGASLPWNTLADSVPWTMFHRSVTWTDLIGVSAGAGGGI